VSDRQASKKPQDLRFEVDAALLFELGEQLVARKSIALAELIKNAYDSDATEVTVTFDGVKAPGGTIVVTDNGSGMTLDDVRSKWMRIATTNKREGIVTPLGRVQTGAKGVGRFAVRKLARRLTLRTRVRVGGEEQAAETVAAFDWDAFRAGLAIGDVLTKVETRPVDVPGTGTSLEMSGVRDAWTDDDLGDVRRDLQDLTPPFSAIATTAQNSESTPSAFSVRFISPEFPQYEGYVADQFLSAAVAKVTGLVTPDGVAQYRLDLRGRVGALKLDLDIGTSSQIEGASFVIHYFKYDSPSLRDFDIGVKEARDYGARFGGVKIYLDNFRVFPYGDAGDDWLNLDAERGRRLTRVDEVLKKLVPEDPGSRPMLAIPGNNNLFGGVFISRSQHPELRPTISRERIVENDAYRQLVHFVRLGIDWMVLERARQDTARRKAEEAFTRTSVKAPTASDAVADTVSQIEERLRNLPASRDTRQISALLDRMQDAVVKTERRDLDKIGLLRILASAGTMVVIFVHQMRAVLDGLRGTLKDLGEVGSGIPEGLEESIDETRIRLRDWTEMLDAQGQQLGLLLGRDARQRRRRLALPPIMDQMRATFGSYARTLGITIEDDFTPGLRTPPMFEAELHSILLNLLTNAIKAVKQEPTRRIQVAAWTEGTSFVLAVRDTGYGVRSSMRAQLFEPFETTSLPDPVLGTGTGVGLTIVRDIVEEHEGKVAFVDAVPPWRTEVRLEIPAALAA
jgi:signal transduction histidine kinase